MGEIGLEWEGVDVWLGRGTPFCIVGDLFFEVSVEEYLDLQ